MGVHLVLIEDQTVVLRVEHTEEVLVQVAHHIVDLVEQHLEEGARNLEEGYKRAYRITRNDKLNGSIRTV